MLKTIHPFHLLNALFNGYKEGAVIKLTDKRLINLQKEFNFIHINSSNISYIDMIEFIKEVVFDKFQAIVGNNELYIKNCKEIKNRLEIMCEIYGDFDLDFILPIWDKVVYEESL